MKWGWKPDLPDKRDLKFRAPQALLWKMPRSVDLTPLMPPVYDQGNLGTCTANAACAAWQFCKSTQGVEAFMPSRLFNYWCSGKLEGCETLDNGRHNRDAVKALAKWGVCREDSTWPYIQTRYAFQPTKEAFIEAEKNQSLIYRRVEQDLDQIRARLAMGYPVVFGFSVYSGFENDTYRTGELSLPGKSERLIGGHAVLAIGYNNQTQKFLIRNSYGPEWGKKGYFWMPYAYMEDEDLAADFWTIELVE